MQKDLVHELQSASKLFVDFDFIFQTSDVIMADVCYRITMLLRNRRSQEKPFLISALIKGNFVLTYLSPPGWQQNVMTVFPSPI